MKEYTLRELCEKCGVTRRAVQWFEKYDLVEPCGKTKQAYLLYSEDTAGRVKKIKALQNYGFSVAEIKHYFECDPKEQKQVLIKKHRILKEKSEIMLSCIKEIEALIETK